MPHDQRRVAHHVVEHSAALQLALPEPGHVRTAVLFRGAREVRAPRRGGATGPDQGPAGLDVWSKKLVLEIAVSKAHTLHQLEDMPCFRDVARERLLARD